MIADPISYLAMKDSGVPWLGEVPEHWEMRRLRNTSEMRVSNVDKHTKDDEQPVRLCNYVDVYKNDRIRSGMAFMRATATTDEIERFRLRSGDVLITKDSEAWNDIGVSALVEDTQDDIVSGYHLALLRPFPERVDGGFLFRALQSTAVAYQFHVEANGVTRYGLSHSAIKSVWLPLPPLAEQAAIVRFLDHADRRIQRYIRAKQKLVTLLEEQKQAIIHRAVTRGLDPNVRLKPSGVEWLGKVPTHWERRRLKILLRPVDRRSATGAETLLSLRRDHGIVIYAEHFARPSQSRSLVGFKLVAVGQLVVNRLQANNGLVFCSGINGLVSPDYSVFEMRKPLQMQYLSDLLRTSSYRSHFRRESTGLGTGTAGFLRLYDDKFLETEVFLPPVQEQILISNSLANDIAKVKRLMEQQQRQLQFFNEFRTRLITDVVTGKLDVREAAARLPDEVEEPEPREETDALTDGEEEPSDDLDTAPEEAAV